jgi:sodium-dependent phosphate transporter
VGFHFVAVLYFDKIPLWGSFVASIGVGLLVMVIVHFIFVPIMRKKIEGNCATG